MRSLLGIAGDEGRELLRDVSRADVRVPARELGGARTPRETSIEAGENDAQREVQRQIESDRPAEERGRDE